MNAKTRTGVSAGLAAALTVIIVYLLQWVVGKTVPPELQGAISTVLTVVVRFFVPERDGEIGSNSAAKDGG